MSTKSQIVRTPLRVKHDCVGKPDWIFFSLKSPIDFTVFQFRIQNIQLKMRFKKKISSIIKTLKSGEKNPIWFSRTIVFYSERGTNNLRFAPGSHISVFVVFTQLCFEKNPILKERPGLTYSAYPTCHFLVHFQRPRRGQRREKASTSPKNRQGPPEPRTIQAIVACHTGGPARVGSSSIFFIFGKKKLFFLTKVSELSSELSTSVLSDSEYWECIGE